MERTIREAPYRHSTALECRLRKPFSISSPRFLSFSFLRPPRKPGTLVRDLAGFLTQQMLHWGRDARQRDGNLLVRLGADRVAREQAFGEGRRRHRFPWHSGLIELHSFCVGWYPAVPTAAGVLVIRGRGRLFGCAGARPLTPGHYEEEQFRPANAEDLLEFCRPLLSWIAAYEERVRGVRGESYREQCFELYGKAGHGRPWLPPEASRAWLEQFLAGPQKTRRAKWLRREGAPDSLQREGLPAAPWNTAARRFRAQRQMSPGSHRAALRPKP
jgi:hypothetical protein